jgi:glutathione S-transferase
VSEAARSSRRRLAPAQAYEELAFRRRRAERRAQRMAFIWSQAHEENEMILYSTITSPNSVPVRIAARFKDLDIAFEEPPGGLGSTKFHAINPVGTVPCLVLDDGFVMPESVAIIDYLDERFPTPPLMPVGARARAEVRVLQRIAELGILNQGIELQALLQASAREEDLISTRLTRLLRGLSSADLYLKPEMSFIGGVLTMADCHLAPALKLVRNALRTADIADLIVARPRLADYLHRAESHAVLGELLFGMSA